MDVLLTSFGMGMKQRARRSIFDRLPPLFTGSHYDRFHIDYAALFMFDRVIVDERSYERALNIEKGTDEADWMRPSFLEAVKKGAAEYAEVLSSLQRSGRVITKSFDEIFARSEPLLEHTTAADMKDPYRWRGPVESAVSEWTQLGEQMSVGFRQAREESRDVRHSPEMDLLAMTAHSLNSHVGVSHHLLYVLKQWKKKQSPEMRERCRDLLKDLLHEFQPHPLVRLSSSVPRLERHALLLRREIQECRSTTSARIWSTGGHRIKALV